MFAVDSFVTPRSMYSQRFLVTRLNIPVVLLPAILYSLHTAMYCFIFTCMVITYQNSHTTIPMVCFIEYELTPYSEVT